MLREILGLCLLLAFVVLTIISAGFLGAVFVNFTVSGRVRPIVMAIIAGVAAAVLGAQVRVLPSAITLFMGPLVVSAVAAGVAMSASDWRTLGISRSERGSPTILGVIGICVGAVCAYLASLTSIGKWVLNSFGQNVVGNMPSEAREIRIAGAVCGFFVGCFVAIILVRSLIHRR